MSTSLGTNSEFNIEKWSFLATLGYFLFLAERRRAVWDFDLYHVGIEAPPLVDRLMKETEYGDYLGS